MESNSTEIIHDFPPLFRVFKDGRVERLLKADKVPPSTDPKAGVHSKDIIVSPETGASARLFLPKGTDPDQKLPLLIYIHGGAFSIQSAFSSLYTNYLNSLVAAANVVAVSVEYRLAPEHPISACYEDSWAVIQWVVSHANGDGPESWLNNHANFRSVFLAGESAGANIAHNMTVRASDSGGLGGSRSVNLVGIALIHPFFGNEEPDKLWETFCPDLAGINDPRLNPAANVDLLAKLRCSKVLICIAGEDHLRTRGVTYYEALKKSGWGGEVEYVETEGEAHVFHLFNPTSGKAGSLLEKVSSFLNSERGITMVVFKKYEEGGVKFLSVVKTKECDAKD